MAQTLIIRVLPNSKCTARDKAILSKIDLRVNRAFLAGTLKIIVVSSLATYWFGNATLQKCNDMCIDTDRIYK